MANKCKYYKEKQQVSYDFGVTWLDTGDYRKGNLYEYQSADCPESTPKWLATYTGGTTSSAECDSTSAITSGEITRTNLISVEIGECVTSIGDNVFKYYFNLKSCTIGSGVTSIGESAFRQCSSLTSITIPDNVTTIGSFAFINCISLTTCTIGSSVTSIGASAFRQCSSLTSVTIPDSTTSINAYAFNDCSGLTSVVIGSGVTSIGNQAFLNCSGLTSITINSVSPPTMQGSGAFNNTNDCPIYVACQSVDAYKSASGWSSYSSRIQGIPPCSEPTPTFDGKWLATYTGGTTSSAECDSTSAITQNEVTTTDLVEVLIGDCVTSIGNRAFWLCSSLTSVTIGNGVTSIGSDAFYICKTLTSITIPNTVTTIGAQAFAACRSITSLTIPDSVTTIGNRAFGGCSGLTSCTIGSGVTSIGDSGFTDNASIASITVNAITPPTLGSSAFDNTNNCPIYVPCQSVGAYKSASGWSSYSSRIQAIP